MRKAYVCNTTIMTYINDDNIHACMMMVMMMVEMMMVMMMIMMALYNRLCYIFKRGKSIESISFDYHHHIKSKMKKDML